MERKRWCSENFVSDRSLRKAADIHAQLKAQLAVNLQADAAGASGAREQHPGLAADAEDTTMLRRALTHTERLSDVEMLETLLGMIKG